jgi:single-stranded-DNA-specific exonuclease
VGNWRLRREDDAPSELRSHWGELSSRALWSRNLGNHSQIDAFLQPRLSSLGSPFRLRNLEAAAERLLAAIEAQQKIVIYADYDVDGMSACALLFHFLKDSGAKDVSYYVPHRFEEGYGVHVSAIEKIAAERSPHVLITVDNGITAVEAVAKARQLGMDVILTDHHLPKEKLPETPWLINPNTHEDESGLGYLCGAGVAFYLCMGLFIKAKAAGLYERLGIPVPRPKEYLDYFALATLADQMQLVAENRILVKAGLEQLRSTRRPGLQVLLRSCIDDLSTPLTARAINFGVVPKLNAASRMGVADKSLRLLLASSWSEAEENCEALLVLNEQRVQTQGEVWAEAAFQAEEQVRANAPVLILKGKWHEGVLGIVAAKIVEKFALPSIVMSEEGAKLKGSMRTIPGFHCVRLLEKASHLLLGFGGHEQAAGLQLEAKDFAEFQECLWQAAWDFRNNLAETSAPILFDGFWDARGDEKDFLILENLSPYGPGNPEPLFCVKNLTFPHEHKLMKEKHMKWQQPGMEFLAFNKAEEILKLAGQASSLDILVTPEVNRFRGRTRLQCRVEHVRPALK